MIICSLHTPPGDSLKWSYHFTDRIGTWTNKITDGQVIYLVMTIRAYFVVRIVGLYITQKLRGAAVEILRCFAGVDFDLSFSLRYMLINHTYKILLGFLLSVVLWCSYGIRMCERNFAESNVLNIGDAIWLTLITAATIGFGDFFPSTHCGRSAAIIAAFAGAGHWANQNAVSSRHHDRFVSSQTAGMIIQAVLVGVASAKIKLNPAGDQRAKPLFLCAESLLHLHLKHV